jgi:NADPH-dependent glutamate synthase beta subunit-like oxidoreductase
MADMPAIPHEVQDAILEGVKFEFMMAPNKIVGQNGKVTGVELMKMKPGKRDKTGRKVSEPTGECVQISCDSVNGAIGERSDASFINIPDIKLTEKKDLVVDPLSFQTSNKKVFAAGDFVTGPSTAAESMGLGKRAAFSIDEILTGQDNRKKFMKVWHYNQEVPEEPECGDRNVAKELKVPDRIHNFNEVVQDLTKSQALLEGCRCLRCDVKEKK